jgi:hypothetical protein
VIARASEVPIIKYTSNLRRHENNEGSFSVE